MDTLQDFAHCHLTEPAQIAALLQELCRRQTPISLRLDNSDLYSASTVLEVDLAARRLRLDASAAQSVNACLARGQPVHVHAQLDKVDVRFILPGLDPSDLSQDKAFAAGFPAQLLHLQRRELYRLSTPLSRWPLCEIALDADSSDTVTLRVADIGPGGMALVHDLPAAQLGVGLVLQQCRLHIPDGPTLNIDIRICNDRRIHAAEGNQLRRTGIAFDNLSQSTQSHLSRYIFALDRLRNARRQGQD